MLQIPFFFSSSPRNQTIACLALKKKENLFIGTLRQTERIFPSQFSSTAYATLGVFLFTLFLFLYMYIYFFFFTYTRTHNHTDLSCSVNEQKQIDRLNNFKQH